jgi:hypothetical protein
MASSRRLAASNQRNAQRSTGPRSRQGKARASRNAWRHGLAACATWTGPLAPDLERLTDAIAGPNPDSCRRHFANIAAEAEFELRRVRAARLTLIAPLTANLVETKDRDADADRPAPSAILKSLARLDRYERRATSRRNRALRLL